MLLYPIMYNTLLRVIWNWVLRGAPKLGERERENPFTWCINSPKTVLCGKKKLFLLLLDIYISHFSVV